MERVSGIGGVFFRAKDPKALADWYQRILGINPGASEFWQADGGATVFAPFAEDTGYFGPGGKQWMMNFRVSNLQAMIAQLENAGLDVETRDEWDGDGEFGRFARIHDPEGNPIELWQPPES